ncbi:MAG: hypothetical protein KKE24_08120 [Candidatus Thermoplasmatota archaeon]|nr:hypothetical protein [Candidatus Thermoplasmatota archaeon]
MALLMTIALIGIVLIALGILIINNGSHIGLYFMDGHYVLNTPDKTVVNAGILMTVIGTIAVSASISCLAMHWIGRNQKV